MCESHGKRQTSGTDDHRGYFIISLIIIRIIFLLEKIINKS